MLPALTSRFAAIETQRTRLLEELRGLASEDLARRPAEGAWSINEVVEHLVIAEELSLRLLEKEAPAERGNALRSTFRIHLIRAVFRYLSVRIKAPSTRLLPSGTASLDELAARWGEARCRLAGYLGGLTADTARARPFRHPLAGWITPAQWVDFIGSHVLHHQGQIARVSSMNAYLNATSRR